MGRLAVVLAALIAAVVARPAAANSQPRVPPIAAGAKMLRALVIEVTGRAQWRPAEDAPWRDAAVNDVLPVGSEVRTGLRSSLALRVGRNATVVIDRSTRLSLPVILQDGETLRTRAGLRRGKADFKVDVIGLTNDFEVLTPTTTLAVRGTGFGVAWGGLDGARVQALDARVFAIELRYLLSQMRYLMRSGQVSTETLQNPVVHALFRTFDRPMPSLTDNEFDTDLTQLGYLLIPAVVDGRRVVEGMASTGTIEELLEELALEFVCDNLGEFFGDYLAALDAELGFESFGQLEAFGQMVADVEAFCENLDGFEGDPLAVILERISAFCSTYTLPLDQQRCESLFHDILDERIGAP